MAECNTRDLEFRILIIYIFEVEQPFDQDTKKRTLSTNRAETVYKYFLMKRIVKTRMTFKGYGNRVPLGKGYEYDRRVELMVTKKLG